MVRAALVSLFLYSSEGIAQNHLEPAVHIIGLDDLQAEYYAKTRDVLFPNSTNVEKVRFLMLPSFGFEQGMRILFNSEDNEYFIENVITKTSIWESVIENWNRDSKMKKNLNIGVNRTIVSLENEWAELIIEMYNAALHSIKIPDQPRLGLDGVTYYLSDHNYTGKVWSPKNGFMKDLVEISKELRNEAVKSKQQLIIESELLSRITALEKQLTNN